MQCHSFEHHSNKCCSVILKIAILLTANEYYAEYHSDN